jgi:hypothetical protein
LTREKWAEEEYAILSNPNLTDAEKVRLLPKRTEEAATRQRAMKGFASKRVKDRYLPWREEELGTLRDSEMTIGDKIKSLPNRSRDEIGYYMKKWGYVSKPRQRLGKYVLVNVDGEFIQRHRIVAEKKIGRPLKDNEVVHHINMDTTDDKPENLFIGTQSDHKRIEGTVNTLVKQLMDIGVIDFDRKSNKYLIKRK